MISTTLPLYVVVDVSFSTTDRVGDTTGIEQTNRLVRSLVVSLAGTPSAAGRVRLSLIDFADEAMVQVPLTLIAHLGGRRLPVLAARGGTSWASAFTLARDRITADLAQLRADGIEPGPALLVFVTDGDPVEPDRDWQDAFAALVAVDHGPVPRIWPVGYGAASRVLLDRLVSPPGWTAPLLGLTRAEFELPGKVVDVLEQQSRAERPAVNENGDGPFVAADPDELAWDEPDAADVTAPGALGGASGQGGPQP